ncbi:MerR family transcriptional regulator [Gracilibacillus massiliensis]|uniref:MerR family transcriptional regulator n=1 Tax=Gracilibacillus massiliensis TaxID=1564956 RepID=UPI00071D34E3|nr:cobalamin-dependent protein [Gracilibacillus massiliensis]
MYGIKKVSDITGISPITLRAWENRYDVIKPERTDGGTRIYTKENVDDLLWVINERTTNKVTVKEAMLRLKEKKEAISPNVESVDLDRFQPEIDTIFDALKQYHTDLASDRIHHLLRKYDYELIFHHVFVPILRRVGEHWQNGTLHVAQEHFISHYLQRFMQQYFHQIKLQQEQPPRVIALCPPEELHHIGLLLFSIFLKRRGFAVLFIGENTPIESLIHVIEENEAKLVCFSVTMNEHAISLESTIKRIKQNVSTCPNIVIGGNGVNHLPKTLESYILIGGLREWTAWHKKIMEDAI